MKISKENIITKKDFLKILQDTTQNQIINNRFGKCLVEFLQKHPETYAFIRFKDFFEFFQADAEKQEINDYYQYLKHGWSKIFENIEDEVEFIERWMNEEESELFFKFLEEECKMMHPSWEKRRIQKILERYLKSVNEDKKYSGYWKEENAEERFFDGYISFIYNYPNSKTARKFQELFEKECEEAIDILKSELSNECYIQFMEDWIDEEDVNLFNNLLEDEFNLSRNPKKRLLQILENHVENIGKSDFSRIADCLIMFLYEYPNSKTFESFLEYAEKENWLCSNKPWDPFFGVKNNTEFIHEWIDKSKIDMFKKFLKEECELEIENDPETK